MIKTLVLAELSALRDKHLSEAKDQKSFAQRQYHVGVANGLQIAIERIETPTVLPVKQNPPPSLAQTAGKNSDQASDNGHEPLTLKDKPTLLLPDAHSTHITVAKLGSGWAAVCMWWNETGEHGLPGFWEPWQTGIGRYATEADAIEEGKVWADCEKLPYQYTPEA